MYKVTVVASGGKQAVEVTVTDVDEPGKVTFDQPQPQATRGLVAMGPGDPDADVDDVSWQWSRCTTKDNADDCTDIAGATTTSRSPTTDDVLMYLRATATYTDTHGDQSASAATDNPVEPRTLANAAPEFDDIDPITVNENVKGDIGEPIMATDADNDVLLYGKGTLQDDQGTDIANDNDLFDVSTGGQISLKAGLDYETPGDDPVTESARVANPDDSNDGIPDGAYTYTVVVKATDPSTASTSHAVSVYLTDVEETPKFGDNAPKELTVVEGTTALLKPDGDDDGTEPDALEDDDYTATDPGEDDTPFTYGKEGADAGKFDFSATAVLTLSAAADIDDKSSYSITLTVTDANTDNFNKLDVTVKVVDAEEAGEVKLSSREPQVGTALVATLEDNDGGETAVTWQWYRGGAAVIEDSDSDGVLELVSGVQECSDTVAADATTSCSIADETSALYTPGDDDVDHTLHAVATYQDDQGGSTEEYAGASSEKPAQEADPANTAPSFPDQDLNTAGDQSDVAMRSVAENAKNADVGQPLEAEDDNGDLLTYALSGPDADSFKLTDLAPSSNSVTIQTAVELDFEAQSMHTVVLTAMDPSSATDSITVMITVTDENDDAEISVTEPTCEMDGDILECMYLENGDDPVAEFSASDPDADADDIEWSLEGVDKGIFKISDEGVLTFDKKPDFEGAKDGDEDTAAAGDQGAGDNVYKVTVVASGGKQAVEVTVTDVDEPGKVTFDQPQPQATRGLVAMGPGDPDADVDDVSWQWSRCMSDDNPDDCTDIAGATTTSRNPTTADVGYYLRATVTYVDTHGDQSASAATDNPVEPKTSANAAPEFKDIDPITVNENVKGDIGEPIMATDADNDVLLYGKGTLQDDQGTDIANDNDLFDVSTGGQISLKAGLDYETPGDDPVTESARVANPDDSNDGIPDGAYTYTVVVKATDPSTASTSHAVSVYLTDVEETPKFGDNAPKELTVVEGTTALLKPDGDDDGTEPDALEDDDYTATDPGEDDTPFTYGKEGADAGKFDFSATAVLTLSAAADIDDKSSYSITLTVTDANTDNFNKLDVTVKVVDAEEAGEVKLSSREPQVGTALVATLEDNDGGETAVTWQWYRGGAAVIEDSDSDGVLELVSGVQECSDTVAADATTSCSIADETSALYTPGDDDVDHTLHAVATYQDDQGGSTEEYAGASSEKPAQEGGSCEHGSEFP